MLEAINKVLWGPIPLAALAIAGLYFTVGTGWLPVRQFGAMWRHTLGSLFTKRDKTQKGISPFQAMSTALACCLGTGNISGVAAALVVGGPGALLWMWVSAFLSMAIKYAEVVLATYYRKRGTNGWLGGPMYYIEQGLGKNWKWLANGFAVICLVATLGTGNFTQVGAMAEALEGAFGIPPLWVGLGATALVALAIFGGIQGISKITELLVPIMTLLYTGGALWVLGAHADSLLPALQSIVRGAFGLEQAAGGLTGFTVARAMRFGVARGIFSNEAGMGTSPIAHASAECKDPAKHGLWGAMEVCLDTLIMCTITGLVVLVSGAYGQLGADGLPLTGAMLTGAAFSTVLGNMGGSFVAICMALFALTSVMGWSCYGESCCLYLFGEKKLPLTLFRLGYLCAIPLGAVMGMERVWALADLFNFSLLLPNMVAILLLSGKVFQLTRRSFGGRLPNRSKNARKFQM